MGAWPYPPWLVSCNERSVFVPEWTTPQLSSMCLTLSPLVSLMYRAKCINPRVNNSPKFMVVCYSVVWYCMVVMVWYGSYYRWVLSTDGCEDAYCKLIPETDTFSKRLQGKVQKNFYGTNTYPPDVKSKIFHIIQICLSFSERHGFFGVAAKFLTGLINHKTGNTPTKSHETMRKKEGKTR